MNQQIPDDELEEILSAQENGSHERALFLLFEKAAKYPLCTKLLHLLESDVYSGVFDDVATAQLKGFGASNFLVHENETSFQVVAEWRSGSGNIFDRDYGAHALRTWHLLARDILRLREQLRRKTDDGSG